MAVNQDHFGSDVSCVRDRLQGGGRCRDENTLAGPLPLQSTHKPLDLRASRLAQPALDRDEDRVESQAVFFDDPINAAFAALSNTINRILATAPA